MIRSLPRSALGGILGLALLSGCVRPGVRDAVVGETPSLPSRSPHPIVDVRCGALRDSLAPALATADSLLLRGDAENALDTYRTIQREVPECAITWARVGDTHRLRGRVYEALDAYERAAALDACGSGVAGRAATRLPTRPGADARLEEILAAIDELTGCGELSPAALSVAWRANLLLGRTDAMRRTLARLSLRLTPAELTYGRNLLRAAGPGAVLVTGSDVETDLALSAARGMAEAPIVLDLELLEHPRYVAERMNAGLDVGLDAQAVGALTPSVRDGRMRSVAEDVLGRVLEAAGHAPAGEVRRGAIRTDPDRVVFSHRASARVVFELSPRLSVTGLVLVLDGEVPGVDPDAIGASIEAMDLRGLDEDRPPLGTADSYYWRAEVQRLLTGYATSALKGAVAAFQRGRYGLGESLTAYARARAEEVGVSGEMNDRIDQIGRYAER